jgi:hypothetical protein
MALALAEKAARFRLLYACLPAGGRKTSRSRTNCTQRSAIV